MNLSTRLKLILSQIVKPVYGGRGHILMFHRVTPDMPVRVKGQSRLEVSPSRLEEIILFFRSHNYDFISLDEVYNRLSPAEKTARYRRKFVVFTFDDGYADNLQYAYPLFKQYNIPFAIYVAASFPQREAVLWWYLLDDLILSNDRLQIALPEGPLTLDCRRDEQKTQASRTLRARLKFAPRQQYPALLDAIFTQNSIDLMAKTEQLALSWENLQQLSRDPLVTIGSHSLHHFPLKILSDAEAWEEITASKELIEQKLGKPVEHFAYPYGEWREAGAREFEMVKKSGYKTAVTTRFASLFPGHTRHMHALPRFDAPALSDQDWVLAVNGLLPLRRNRLKRVVIE